jgi:hypothetical protein
MLIYADDPTHLKDYDSRIIRDQLSHILIEIGTKDKWFISTPSEWGRA